MSMENSTIIAFLFSQSKITPQIYENIHRFHNEGKFNVLDVCEFDIKENSKIHFQRAMMLPLIGTGDEMFLEAFAGLIYFNAPHNENVNHAIREISLDRNFIQTLSKFSVPGSSVIFVHVNGQPEDGALKKLASQADHILSMALTPEQESKLEILFHGKAPAEAASANVSLH